MSLPQFRLMFDVGIGGPAVVDTPNLLLTHGHLDHAAGVPYYISQRSLRHLEPPTVYCPPETAEPLNKIMELWAEIENFKSAYTLIPIDYDKQYHLQSNYYFQAIRSVHRVPSNGYSIIEKRTKLKPEFTGLSSREIVKLKQERDDLFYETFETLITFSGDTQIEFVLENEMVRKSRILFLECTYIDKKRPVERAREWGHIHLDEIRKNADAFEHIEKLYLIHFSTRYRAEEIKAMLRKRLPERLYSKTTPFLTPLR